MNDIPMLDVFLSSLTFPNCEREVIRAASELVDSPGMSLEDKTLIALERAASNVDVFIGAIKVYPLAKSKS